MNLVEFSDFYGRSMHTGGSERVPMLTFPEAEGNSPAFVLVSARWFLQHVGNEEMVRIAVAAIDADVDQKFQTRIAMKNPVQRADLFRQCRVWYLKYTQRDGTPSGMTATKKSAFEMFYKNDTPLGYQAGLDAVGEFERVLQSTSLGVIDKNMREAIGFAIDHEMATESDRLWLAVPRARVWSDDFDPSMFDLVIVPPPKKHEAISALDLLRSDDPSIPPGKHRFTVNCSDVNDTPKIYLCKTTVDANGEEISACSNARRCFRQTGMMVFARDTGGYPDFLPGEAHDPAQVKAHRHKKAYFCANWQGLCKIMNGEVHTGFDVGLPPPWRPRTEPMNRCVYEYLMEHAMNYPYGDLDCDLEYNPEMLENGDEYTRIAIEFHAYMLKTLFGACVEFSDYFISSADVSKITSHTDGTRTVKGKVSRHFICRKYAFRTMLDQRMFVNWCFTTLFAIFKKVEKDPMLCSEQEKRFAMLRIKDRYGAMRSFPDFGVYKSGCQLFRLFANSKAPEVPFGPQRRLIVAAINEYPIDPGATEMDIIGMSMVQRVPIDFPDNRLLEFNIENNEQIPMMTYELNEDGTVADYHIWNPGDDVSKVPRKRKRRNKKAAKMCVDLSKRYKVSGASGSGTTVGGRGKSAPTAVEKAVLDYVAKCKWAALWEDPSTKNGRRISNGGKVTIKRKDGKINMIIVNPRPGDECPCLLKWYLAEMERQAKDGGSYQKTRRPVLSKECPGHGNCPISIIIHPEPDHTDWVAEQGCEFNCRMKRQINNLRAYCYLGKVSRSLIDEIEKK
ncbi:MAG: hypothetical protein AB7P49_00700 [Bdellovibrionales bacterium]